MLTLRTRCVSSRRQTILGRFKRAAHAIIQQDSKMVDTGEGRMAMVHFTCQGSEPKDGGRPPPKPLL